jgi:hypothetical protein
MIFCTYGFSWAVVVGFVNAFVLAVIIEQMPLIFSFHCAAVSGAEEAAAPWLELPPQPAGIATPIVAAASRTQDRLIRAARVLTSGESTNGMNSIDKLENLVG